MNIFIAPSLSNFSENKSIRNRKSSNIGLITKYHIVKESCKLSFNISYIVIHRPVIVTDVVPEWKASKWTGKFFNDTYGDQRIAMKAVSVRIFNVSLSFSSY